jgi:Zn-dependent protease with chaperone function
VKPLTGFSMQNLFSSHPPTHERVARLRELARARAVGAGGTYGRVGA